MTVICTVKDSSYNGQDKKMVVESHLIRSITIRLGDESITVNGDELKKAIDNCMNS